MNKHIKQLVESFLNVLDKDNNIGADVINDMEKIWLDKLINMPYNKTKYDKFEITDYQKAYNYAYLGYLLCDILIEAQSKAVRYTVGTAIKDRYTFECVFDSDKHYGGPDHCYIYYFNSINRAYPIMDIVCDSDKHITNLYILKEDCEPCFHVYNKQDDDPSKGGYMDWSAALLFDRLLKQNVSIDKIYFIIKNPLNELIFYGENGINMTEEYVNALPEMFIATDTTYKNTMPFFNNKVKFVFSDTGNFSNDNAARLFVEKFIDMGVRQFKLKYQYGIWNSTLESPLLQGYSAFAIILSEECHKHKCSVCLSNEEKLNRAYAYMRLFVNEYIDHSENENENVLSSLSNVYEKDQEKRRDYPKVTYKDEYGKYNIIIMKYQWWLQDYSQPSYYTKIAWRVYESGVCEIDKIYYVDQYYKDNKTFQHPLKKELKIE